MPDREPQELDAPAYPTGYRVTVSPTICDGQVVRWFGSDYAMERCEPIISASRNEVVVHDLHIRSRDDLDNARDLIDWAVAWGERIRNGESFTHRATHERQGFFGPHVKRDPTGAAGAERSVTDGEVPNDV